MSWKRSIISSAVILLALAQSGRSLEVSDFYDFDKEIRLENGANKGEFVKLDTPINFFSDIYDHIYVSLSLIQQQQKIYYKFGNI